jgi:hypothetical protein
MPSDVSDTTHRTGVGSTVGGGVGDAVGANVGADVGQGDSLHARVSVLCEHALPP